MWRVLIPRKVEKAVKSLPGSVQARLESLILDIGINGPVRGNWPNYGKLGDGQHHCHLKKGKPCYVVVWLELNREIHVVEVRYVGTHENAPY